MDLPETRYAKTEDGLNIAYQVVGDGPFDLLFAPGFISHLEMAWELLPGWAPMAERLASFSRLLLFDKRGTGLSDRPGGWPTFEERMDDIRAVLDAAESSRAALLGVSEGGPMSMLFAATYPERTSSLTLWGAAPRFAYAPDWPWGLKLDSARRVLDAVEAGWGQGFVLNRFVEGLADDERTRRRTARYERVAASPGAARAMLAMNFEIDIRPVLSTIQVPTLVIHRRGDPMVPVDAARYLATVIPSARLVELDGEFHMSGRPGAADDALDLVEEFLTGARHDHEVDRVLATVLFTDIVGSTERAAAMGDRRWKQVLDDYDRIVDAELGRFRGRQVKTTGDGTLATFDGPARAMRCGLAIRDAVAGLDLDLRVGIHTGEVQLRGQDVAGIAVHLAQRISALSAPSELLVSRTVVDLVAGSGLVFEDRGEHELKGVPGTWRLFRVAA